MAKLSLTRRSFLKAAAVTGAASTLSFAVAPSAALAEGVDESAGEVKRIRSCCRACGKCECGVWVTVQDNKVIKVEGDESNAHSRGHCCAKSQASMLALYHPDRLRYTMKRTNPKGEDDPGWVRVNFAEAMDEIGAKYNELIDKYGGKSIFSMGGTSRVWAQPPYGTLKSVFGTHNFHSAYEICKGPAPLRRRAHRREGLAVDGGGAGPHRVRAVGYRFRVFQLRLHQPYRRGLLAARLQAHSG